MKIFLLLGIFIFLICGTHFIIWYYMTAVKQEYLSVFNNLKKDMHRKHFLFFTGELFSTYIEKNEFLPKILVNYLIILLLLFYLSSSIIVFIIISSFVISLGIYQYIKYLNFKQLLNSKINTIKHLL